MKRKVVQICMVLIMVWLMAGCGKTQSRTEKPRDLPFTVLAQEQLPAELQNMLEEKKAESFRLTFTDEDALYICVGYGKQPTGGYSISVTELYETENAVYVHTNLLGPSPEETGQESPSYPYIVIKLEKPEPAGQTERPVVFE